VPGQIEQRERLVFVQVIENAGLVRAQDPPCLGISDVPGMAGEVDARIKFHHLSYRVLGHFTAILGLLIWFVKPN
jgi:hypothetical protein